MKPLNPIPDTKNKEAFKLVELAVVRYKSDRPFVVGIAGAGGAGKTTFGRNIAAYFGAKNCISIDLDDYLLSREERKKLGITGYSPRSNKLDDAKNDILMLVSRQTISKPCYDHSTGAINGVEEVEPRELIVLEGVTTLYPQLECLSDVSFFLDALEETQIKSRIERDVKKRGYTLEEALKLFEVMKPDYARFVAPTKNSATVIFEVDTDYIMRPVFISAILA